MRRLDVLATKSIHTRGAEKLYAESIGDAQLNSDVWSFRKPFGKYGSLITLKPRLV